MRAMSRDREYRQILGIRFYVGGLRGALDRMANGGLIVVPAAPALKELASNPGYRDALLNADVVITDSAFMTLVWNLLELDSIRRLSGLEYLRGLLLLPEVSRLGNTFWIMGGPASSKKNLEWLSAQGMTISQEYVYVAPIYGAKVEDDVLLRKLNHLRPRNIIVTLGGGTQEKLGIYLKRRLDYLPSIHCIGAAIAFLSGDQVSIPVWADRCYLGWLFRCIYSPTRYLPRYWSARKLLPLLLRYRSELPAEYEK